MQAQPIAERGPVSADFQSRDVVIKGVGRCVFSRGGESFNTSAGCGAGTIIASVITIITGGNRTGGTGRVGCADNKRPASTRPAGRAVCSFRG